MKDQSIQAGLSALYFTPITAVDGKADNIPSTIQLQQNFPNPFNPTTTISYSIPARANVSMAIENALGQRVSVLVDGDQSAGEHLVRFDGSKYASGVYFVTLRTGGAALVRKMILIK